MGHSSRIRDCPEKFGTVGNPSFPRRNAFTMSSSASPESTASNRCVAKWQSSLCLFSGVSALHSGILYSMTLFTLLSLSFSSLACSLDSVNVCCTSLTSSWTVAICISTCFVTISTNVPLPPPSSCCRPVSAFKSFTSWPISVVFWLSISTFSTSCCKFCGCSDMVVNP